MMKSVIFCIFLLTTALAFEVPIKRYERKNVEALGSGIPIDLDVGSKAFVGVISIGNPGQDINVAFDPSSSALWVPDSSCACGPECDNEKLCPQLCAAHCCAKKLDSDKTTGSCSNKNVFDSERSRTYVKGLGTANLTFLGGNIDAALGYDTLRVGAHYRPGLTANNIQFGVVKEFGHKYQDVNYDGVFGLGLSSEKGVHSPIKQLAEHGVIPTPLLSACIFEQAPDNVVDGVLTIGQVDRQRCHEVTRYVDVEKGEGWAFSATSFNLSANLGLVNASWKGIFDFTTDYLHLPPSTINSFLSFYSGARDSKGQITVNCGRSGSLYLNVGGEIITIPSSTIFAPYSGTDCLVKIKATEPNDKYAFRYGLPVASKNCIVFDYNGRLALPLKKK